MKRKKLKESNFELLVNKKNPLDKNYIPEDLIIIDEQNSLNKTTYYNYLKMIKDARKEGYIFDIDSSYRSYEYQEILYNLFVKEHGEEYASKYCALPGYSEHQTGLAIDIVVLRNNQSIKISDELEEIKWLHRYMHEYGFILRYPKDKESITSYSYEPWHIRFVGNDLAEYLYKNNLSLEEYHIIKDMSLKHLQESESKIIKLVLK